MDIETIDSKQQSNEEVLKKQAESLSRLVKHSDMSVVEIANKIGVDRQTIYLWMRGKFAIPEDKLNLLAVLFKLKPAEIRYGVSLFNEHDLIDVVQILEEELRNHDLSIPNPESKARVIAMLYESLQDYKRALHKNFSRTEYENFARKLISTMATKRESATV